MDYREPSMAEILAATAAELNASKSSNNKDTVGEEVGAEFDYERDKRIVENEATKNGKHWVVNNRGLWARLIGRYRLPQDVAKRAARQCEPFHNQHIALQPGIEGPPFAFLIFSVNHCCQHQHNAYELSQLSKNQVKSASSGIYSLGCSLR